MKNSTFLRMRAAFANKAAKKKAEEPIDNFGVAKTANLKGSFRQKENTRFVDLDAGGMCDICTIRPKTHFVVPCGHSACLVCWTNWLFQDNEAYQEQTTLNKLRAARVKFTKDHVCFVCQTQVKTIKRYSYDHVPRHPYEEDETTTPSGRNREANERSFKFYEVKIDSSYESLVKQLLAVKDDLSLNVVGKLEEVEGHILEFEVNGAGNEERSIVLSVDSITVNEAFNKLNEIFTISHWNKLVTALDEYTGVLNNFESLLDKYITSISETDENEDDDDKSEKTTQFDDTESTIRSFEIIRGILELSNSEKSFLAQWQRVLKMITKLGYEQYLVSNIISKIASANIEGTLNKKFFKEVLLLVSTRKEEFEKDLDLLMKTTIPQLISTINTTVMKIKD